MVQILFDHVPFWSIKSKSLARMGIEFDQSDMLKARLFEPKRLSPRASAKLQYCNGPHDLILASRFGP
jgi:hypothetical protein